SGPNVLRRLGAMHGTAVIIDAGAAAPRGDDIARLLSKIGDAAPVFVITDAAGDVRVDMAADIQLPRPFGLAAFERISNQLRHRRAGPGARPAVLAPAPPRRHRRVLLAEDNVPNQRVARAILRGAGYAIDIAANGQKVVELVNQKPYDVVLMDVNMPAMD